MMHIPFVNLERQLAELKPEIIAAVDAVLNDRSFIQGPHLARFEEAFAQAHGLSDAVGCSSGTAALSLSLKALGVGAGDEVILPAHTFFATAAAVCHVGALPVFADIDPASYGLDPLEVEQRITSRTKAIIPVHLYGVPCRLDKIKEAVQPRSDIAIIEDSAQAHLACYQGFPTGKFSSAATFSFFPGKNLGACGDAGAILTDDASLACHLRKLRNHGRSEKYRHDILGYNQRMDGIQAAILMVKLPYLSDWNARRRKIATRYDAVLKPAGFKVIEPPPGSLPVYHLYVVEISNRPLVQSHLQENGISTGIHYPLPPHRQPAFQPHAAAHLPTTERIVDRILSLPICPYLTEAEQNRVMEAFLEVAMP